MKLDKQTLFLTLAVLVAVILIAKVVFRSEAEQGSASGQSMTLAQIAPFAANILTEEKLAEIDAALKA